MTRSVLLFLSFLFYFIWIPLKSFPEKPITKVLKTHKKKRMRRIFVDGTISFWPNQIFPKKIRYIFCLKLSFFFFFSKMMKKLKNTFWIHLQVVILMYYCANFNQKKVVLFRSLESWILNRVLLFINHFHQTVYHVFCHTGKYLPIRRSILFTKHFLKIVDLFATGLEKK